MSWPGLLKAKENAKNIEMQLSALIKTHNSFTKKELARQSDLLLTELDASVASINEEISELRRNIDDHRKYLDSKSRFMRRHYKML